jgi:hypothetical protein
MSDMPSLLPTAKKGAEVVPLTMNGPHGEWVPTLMYETGEGEHTIRVAVLELPMLADEHLASAMQSVLDILTDAKAVQAAFVCPMWMAPLDADKLATRARDRDDKEEWVMVTYVNRDRTRIECAKVLRAPGEKPRLGPWDRVANDLDFGGGFADVLRLAIG